MKHNNFHKYLMAFTAIGFIVFTVVPIIIALLYFHFSKDYEYIYQETVICVAENMIASPVTPLPIGSDPLIGDCKIGIDGVRLSSIKQLKDGGYIESITEEEKSDIITIIEKIIKEHVALILNKDESLNFLIIQYAKDEISKDDKNKLKKEISKDNYSSKLLQKISEYLEIKDA